MAILFLSIRSRPTRFSKISWRRRLLIDLDTRGAYTGGSMPPRSDTGGAGAKPRHDNGGAMPRRDTGGGE
jgi:hypothetical protein